MPRGLTFFFKQDPKETLSIQKTHMLKHQILRLNLRHRRLSLNTFFDVQQNVTFLKDFSKKSLTNFSWPFQCVFWKIKKLVRDFFYSFKQDPKETLSIQKTHMVKHQILRLNLGHRRLSLNTFFDGQQNVTFFNDFGKKFFTNSLSKTWFKVFFRP